MPRQHRNFEEEAVQFVRSKQDPPWIEERFIDEVIGE
jgi:hypothetical protein